MVKLRDDFSLTALVMPEFMRPGSRLYALVPPNVHEARRKAAEMLSVEQDLMESRLVDFCVREPLDPGPKYTPSTPTVRSKLNSLLNPPNSPWFGPDYPYFKPPVKTLLKVTKDTLAPLESRFSLAEEVKGGNMQITIEPLQPEAPFFFFVRFLKNPPKCPAEIYFGAVYHTWRDPILLSQLASDYRTLWVYDEDDVSRMLQTGRDYINGIADFLEGLN